MFNPSDSERFCSGYIALTSGIFIGASTICPSNVAMSSCNNSCAPNHHINGDVFTCTELNQRTAFCTSGDSLSKLTFIGSDSGSTGQRKRIPHPSGFLHIFGIPEINGRAGMPGLSSQTKKFISAVLSSRILLRELPVKFGAGAAFITGFNGEWPQRLHLLLYCLFVWNGGANKDFYSFCFFFYLITDLG